MPNGFPNSPATSEEVAELLNIVYYRGDAPKQEIDTLTEYGIYMCRNVQWVPSGIQSFGNLIVSPGYLQQTVVDITGKVAIRVKSNNEWSSWILIK